MKLRSKIAALATGFICTCSIAENYFVTSPSDYESIAKSLEAGDNVVLANGEWEDFELLLAGQGTAEEPITLSAEEAGKVILTGQSNLRLVGQHLIVSGLTFRDGYTPSSAVIEFRRNKEAVAFDSRVTNVVIENYSNPDRFESDFWVSMYGQRNRVDHSAFVGKTNKGVTFAVRLNTEESQSNHHRIDHNYFGHRPELGSNGGETLRIGTSHYSLSDSFTLVENNVFDRTNGEVEIISVKSGKNTIRNNLFYEARGTLTLRHGNGNLIEGNVFLGNGVDHTGGVRIINADQVVRNNYFEGLRGYRFGSGFTVMNGVPNSPINRYHQVDNALIENNTLVDVSHIQFAAGSDDERSAAPINSTFRNNLIVNTDGKSPFTAFDSVDGINFSNNLTVGFNDEMLGRSDTLDEDQLARDERGLLSTKDNLRIGASRLQAATFEAVGPQWYEKKRSDIYFGAGREITISPNEDAIFDAIEAAQDGDVIVLSPGSYNVRKVLPVSRIISIVAKDPSETTISFERQTLFEIRNHGSLRLEGLTISGAESPDSSGNTVIRTQKWGMFRNYRLELLNNTFESLDINRSFHLFESGARAFATEIIIQGNTISDVSGNLLVLDKEIDDLGIYNAEYVTITDNTLSNVKGSLISLYRGGRDESTFGPHFLLANNNIDNVGSSEALVYLHGVQVTSIKENSFKNSGPIVIEHTVGEPISRIESNCFQSTGEISVVELVAPGNHTAHLDNPSC
ncbi:polysaccharide lyase 6 family protein [Umboniibacter marinipuniceus]|uniref:Poly(Beta-D-mannuronate) lyase n=1 Tax=Umboniibacter marinipuniceus TaxID=569599 RepID=A0A3M0ATN3_9GAMM|nr:polysaccharide lyase 6 family protein [Umboniibacter marinipuniceus]RMA82292.1 poly(beta-D-mannuronate) lyase [Umboniibacter marinipuniceus]